MGPIGTWLVSLSSLTPYLLVIAGFSVLYVLIPNTRVHVKPAVIGGVFAGVLWAGSGNLFTGFVVSVSRMEGIYSGFAIVLVAMIWLHLSWLILLLGAQLAFYLQNPEYLRLGKRTESMSNGLRERLALSTMLLVGHDFDKPGHGWRTESLAAKMRIQRHLLEPVIASLMHADLLTRTADHRLMPARDPRRIALAEIFDAVRNPDRDSSHDNEWNDTVRVLSETVDAAIRAACRDRTLADIVDADTRIQAVAKINEAPPQSGPRAASNQ
jgi:membrane protein